MPEISTPTPNDPLTTTEHTAAERTAAAQIQIVGLHGGAWFGSAAADALATADVIIGSDRLHVALDETAPDLTAERLPLFGPLDEVIDVIDKRRQEGQRVTMIASGDPGFFGIERLLVGRFGLGVDVHPAPSSVGLAFARARIPWDDASVVSCHGRTLARALPSILAAPKVAVLVSAACPPQIVGQALVDARAPHSHVWVCSRLGETDETVTETDLKGLADGTFDPLSVVVLATDAQPISPEAVVKWGRPIAGFGHRQSMITKPEVRAVALSKLELKGAATLWDVGAGSGSVAIEACRIAPGLRAYAIERNPQDCERIRGNATRVAVTTIEGEAPECFDTLANPDRLFVGGGGVQVFEAAFERLTTGGVAVATFAVMSSAYEVAEVLGNMVQLSINRSVEVGSTNRRRLQAENPVFIAWGEKT